MIEVRICESEEHLQVLAALAKRIWNQYFLGLISQAQIDYMVEMNQSYHAIKKAIKEQHYTYFLAYKNEQMIGYCGVKPEENRLFLSKLYVAEEARGKGVSSILLQEAITFARSLQLSSIYLTCNKYNENSLAVYRHKGFTTIDAIQSDIGQGFIMDDYVMQLDIC